MIVARELARDYSHSWECAETPDLSPTLGERLNGISKRLRDIFTPSLHLPADAKEFKLASLDALEVNIAAPDTVSLRQTLSDMGSRVRGVAMSTTENLALDLPVFGYSFMSVLSGLVTAEASKAPHGELAAMAFLACTVVTSWGLAREVFREEPRTLAQINARARE